MMTRYIYVALFLIIGAIGFSSCKKDEIEENKTLEVNRVFSPTGLTASVVNQTGIRLNWEKVNNAKTYIVEAYKTLDFSGTPIKAIKDITFEQVPYTLAGLEGDTEYAIRVKAVGEGIADSKWITSTIKTDAEQIFNAVKSTDIAAKTVILTWPAGEMATTIVLTPGNITHVVKASEVAAGSVTITGLVGETEYTAKLMNGNTTRGTVTFETAVDIGDAILITSLSEFNAALTQAVGGETFALAAGEYDFTGSTAAIAKSISIVAVKITDRPVLKNVTFNVQNGAALMLKNLIIDGSGGTLNHTVTYAAGNFGDLEIEGSIVRNYGAGVLGLTSSTVSTITSVRINNNIFNTFGTNGEFIDMRASFTNKLIFSNNTLYGHGARDFIRMDSSPNASYPASKIAISVTNNTIYGGLNSSRRLFYVRIPAANHEIAFTNNLVVNTEGLLANQAATNIVTLSGNNYFAAPSMISSSNNNVKVDAGGTTLDPGFDSPATGTFTLSNATLKEKGIGDPRWR